MVNLRWWDDPEQLRLLHERFAAVNMDRRQFLRIVGAAGGSGAVALAVSACGGTAGTTTAATATTGSGATTPPGTGTAGSPAPAAAGPLAADQTFHYNAVVEPLSFDFNKNLYCQGDSECFAQLAQFDPDNNVVPDIAESWEPNDDASVWTFHLRRDSKWSNGDPVTAHDYEWSYKRQLDPETAAAYAGFLYDLKNGQAFNLGEGGVTRDDVGVQATDDYTLVCTLEGPRAYFPVLAAYVAAAPSHQASVEQFGDKWTEAENIVCNGPYTLTEWNHNVGYTLTRNDNYWNAQNITLQKVVRPIIPDTGEFLAYQNGEIDFMDRGSLGDLQRVQSDPTLSQEFIKYNLQGTWYLEPSVTFKPFDVKEVRLAMAHAIDAQTIVDQVLQGLGTVAYNINPPGMPGFNENKYEEFTTYDPEKAMSLLRGTPYEGGKNWPPVTITMRNNEGDGPRAAGEAIAAMLGQNLGMNVRLAPGDPTVVYNQQYQHELQCIWWRWYIDYPDPNNTQYLVFYSKFPTGQRNTFTNDEYDRLVSEAAGVQDQTQRFQMYWDADTILHEEGYAIFVYNPWNYGLLKPYVSDMPRNKDGDLTPAWNVFVRMYDYMKILEH